MEAHAVAKNGLPRIKGSFGSSSISKTTKSVGTSRCPILTGKSSNRPGGCLTDLSAKTKEILLGENFANPSRCATDSGMKLTEAPKSQRQFLKLSGPIEHGRVKEPGSWSFSLYITFCWVIALHS